MTVRRVVVSQRLINTAQEFFPPGCTSSPDGSPGYSLFEEGPLAAAISLFAHAFDSAQEAAGPVRVWMTIDLPFFPPMAFYAAEVDDHIELLNVSIEAPQEYWALVADDPS